MITTASSTGSAPVPSISVAPTIASGPVRCGLKRSASADNSAMPSWADRATKVGKADSNPSRIASKRLYSASRVTAATSFHSRSNQSVSRPQITPPTL